jgi:hypothetical protein
MAYLPLSTANLPDPAIDPAQGSSPADYFDVFTWTGTGNTGRSFTDLSFQPDWVWAKDRTNAYGHVLFDSVRGAGANKELGSQSTGAEGYASTSTYDYLSSFDSNGFTSTYSGSNFAAYFNKSGDSYVAWNWKANGSGVSNTDGSITSTVSANTESGFSIVSYTGNGSSTGATVGHGLSSAPSMIVFKNRDSAVDWDVFHTSIGATNRLHLNTTAASATTDGFNNTAPTTSVFTVNFGSANVNAPSTDYIAYCFHSVEGFSKFGSYDDAYDGSDYDASSPFVYTGFRPAFVMIKGTSSGREWVMYDNKRTPDNGVYLRANSNGTEQTDATNHDISFNANGFKIRGGSGDINTTNESYVYMAFADQPFKYANGGTE